MLGTVVKQIIANLEKVNIDEFMLGRTILLASENWIVNKNAVFDYLVKPNEEVDSDCKIALQVILPAILGVLSAHFGPLIALEFTFELRSATASVPSHNKFAETIFAATDFLIQTKPNIHHMALEAHVMYFYNGTHSWLKDLVTAERNITIDWARKNTPQLEALYKQRKSNRRSGTTVQCVTKVTLEKRVYLNTRLNMPWL